MSLPIDGSCDSEISVKGLSAEQTTIGPWWEDLTTENQDEGGPEMNEEEDYNENVYFVELGGKTLQVGNKKGKRKAKGKPGEVAATDPQMGDGKKRKKAPPTCTKCGQTGHRRDNKKCLRFGT